MEELSTKNKKLKLNINVYRIVETTNNLGITDKHPSENKMKQVIDKLNKPLRKVAHASEYLIFTILIIIALKYSGVNIKIKIINEKNICL